MNQESFSKFQPQDIGRFKQQALIWADEFESFVFLSNNEIAYPDESFINVLAVKSKGSIEFLNILSLSKSVNELNHWHFGFFSYDFKNYLEELESKNTNPFNFPDLHFFIPETLIFFLENEVEIISKIDPNEVYNIIINISSSAHTPSENIELNPTIKHQDYIQNVKAIKNHILAGDIYEMNYCLNFKGKGQINPRETFFKLNQISPMPFSTLMKFEQKYLICASPERFLKKTGDTLISQPIKGTIKRSKDADEDKALAKQLQNSTKERSENIMIVDLVRNDLSKTALAGSVKVKELCKVYSFNTVHQMISTVTASIDLNFSGLDSICSSFPMGSMTGAPKISAMKLIDQFEDFKRGIYSGSIGYFTPNGDFDFNVIIRSIIYDDVTKEISCPVGSAITYYCDPEKEYEECLLKVETMRKALLN